MEKERVIFLEKIFAVWGFILIIWAIYRYFIELPELVDELILKPLIFLTPALIFVFFKEKKNLSSIGLVPGKFVRDMYVGLGFGALFALEGIITNAVKYGTISLAPAITVTAPMLILALVVSVASAFSEELLVRGFLYTRLREGYQSHGKALLTSTGMYMLLLVPVIFTRLSLDMVTLVIFLVSSLVMSFANTTIFSETKTLTIPILIHAFWNMAVVLYL